MPKQLQHIIVKHMKKFTKLTLEPLQAIFLEPLLCCWHKFFLMTEDHDLGTLRYVVFETVLSGAVLQPT